MKKRKRIEELEQALQTIRTWATCFEVRYESPKQAMLDIRRMCDIALNNYGKSQNDAKEPHL